MATQMPTSGRTAGGYQGPAGGEEMVVRGADIQLQEE